MRGRGVIAAVLAACGAVALAVPAHADQYDFIMQLDNMGVSYESMIDMIDIGKELCHDLRSGATPPLVLGKLQNDGIRAGRVGDHPAVGGKQHVRRRQAKCVAWAWDNSYTRPV